MASRDDHSTYPGPCNDHGWGFRVQRSSARRSRPGVGGGFGVFGLG